MEERYSPSEMEAIMRIKKEYEKLNTDFSDRDDHSLIEADKLIGKVKMKKNRKSNTKQ